MKKKPLEAEWISFSNFKENHEQHNYNLSNMDKVLGEGRFNVENGQSCVSNKRSKYDIDVTMNKDAYLYKGPKEDIFVCVYAVAYQKTFLTLCSSKFSANLVFACFSIHFYCDIFLL